MDAVDPRCADPPAEFFSKFWHDRKCCKDPWFSTKIHDVFHSLQEMTDSVALKNSLANWARTSKVANMHVERLLARIKGATPGKVPLAERLLAAGGLASWLTRHTATFDGEDPTGVTRQQLIEMGTPLRAAAAEATTFKGGLRPCIAYANDKIASIVVADGHCDEAERRRRYLRCLFLRFHMGIA